MTYEPPPPSRQRLIRASFYRSGLTGSLAPDVRDLFIGLLTVTDDEGWLLWRPAEIAATVYAYQPARKRQADLERRVKVLVASGLLVIRECGCAVIPTLKEHHGLKGGKPTTAIWAWHQHAHYVPLRSDTEDSLSPSLVASSSSFIEQAAAEIADGTTPAREATAERDMSTNGWDEWTAIGDLLKPGRRA
jgi:hypothetical protein